MSLILIDTRSGALRRIMVTLKTPREPQGSAEIVRFPGRRG
jgi:hypothetical protein